MTKASHPTAVRAIAWSLGGVAALALAVTLDPWAYHHVVWVKVYETDWGRALRTMGYWPTWMVVALTIWLDGRPAAASVWRARLLAVSVTAAGLLGEVCKMLLRRERPNAHDGAYVFRAFADHPFSTSGIGLPSSHAFLAFAAAGALARLFPTTALIWYALAAGCAATRVLSQAHFLSDVVAGAVLGLAVAAVAARTTPLAARNQESPP